MDLRFTMETRSPLSPDNLTKLVQALRVSLQPPPIKPSASACPMAKPATYSGEVNACSGFLLQCSLYFELQNHQFVSDRAKIVFIMSLLSGKALQWVESFWNSRSPLVRSLDDFVDHFRDVFGKSTSAISVHDELFRQWQADMSINTTTQFDSILSLWAWVEWDCSLICISAWSKSISQTTNVHLWWHSGAWEFPAKALHISQHLTACHTEESLTAVASPGTIPPATEPMQTDRYHLSLTEWARRVTQGLCLYCGSSDHRLPALFAQHAQRWVRSKSILMSREYHTLMLS